MARSLKPEEISRWLENQILVTQIDWMDRYEAGDEELRRQQEVILDGIYAFREAFFEVPVPAPGQGYEPPEEVWNEIVMQRKVAIIDAQISDLMAQREAITGPEPRIRRGEAVLSAQSNLRATA